MAKLFECAKKKPRYKWFAHWDQDCDDGWYGPCATIEEAVLAVASELYEEHPVFVAQGYKMTKAEIEENCAEYEWQVDTRSAMKILPAEIV